VYSIYCMNWYKVYGHVGYDILCLGAKILDESSISFFIASKNAEEYLESPHSTFYVVTNGTSAKLLYFCRIIFYSKLKYYSLNLKYKILVI
jgi:hypothetical protein